MDRLHTLPPQPAKSLEVNTSPFWIGSGADAHCRVFHPAVRARHAVIIERGDGRWLLRGEGDARVNGQSVGAGLLLTAGATIELTPGCAFRFNEVEQSVREAAAPAPVARVPRRRPKGLKTAWHISPKLLVAGSLALVMLVAGGLLIWRALRPAVTTPQELTLEQAITLDSLLRETYDHIERGSALLEIGASAPALREFADGINILQTHPLHSHPGVAPRILALEGAVADMLRARGVTVPRELAGAKSRGSLAGAGLTASLSVDDFRRRFAEVDSLFNSRFGKRLFVTGNDHAEHLSLYGPGSALDLRTSDLTSDRVQFVVSECLRRGIRVKDFSQDAILRQQVEAAIRAGHADRAGTGLHLHVDRFAGRRDRWTVASP